MGSIAHELSQPLEWGWLCPLGTLSLCVWTGGQVSPQDKEKRAKLMGELVEKSRKDFFDSQLGKTEEVLFERLRHGYLEGYTKNYTPVHVYSTDDSLCGQIKSVRLIEIGDDCCIGELSE